MGADKYSDFIVFADESGDHGMVSIDPEYPIFVLTFCVIAKAPYIDSVIPAVERLKFDFWGHDSVILHEHDIRKSKDDFAFLRTSKELRERFYDRMNELMANVPFDLFASVIDKERHRRRYTDPWNPYEIALHFCMEQLHELLYRQGEHGKIVHVVFESRGKAEDESLELEFLRIAGNRSQWGYRKKDFSAFSFSPVFIPKASNSVGLQLADLTARPIGLHCLRRDQPNRAFDVIRPKIRGLKTFP